MHRVDRNKRTKSRPERCPNRRDLFDLILTHEKSLYDQVVEDQNSGERETCQAVRVINREHMGQRGGRHRGAFLVCALRQCVPLAEDTANASSELLQEVAEKSGRTVILHAACLYLPARSAFPGSRLFELPSVTTFPS